MMSCMLAKQHLPDEFETFIQNPMNEEKVFLHYQNLHSGVILYENDKLSRRSNNFGFIICLCHSLILSMEISCKFGFRNFNF